MAKTNQRAAARARRRLSIRKKISGTTDYPRLAVSRSLKHIYAQIIDDSAGKTLASASSVALKISGADTEGAKAVGTALAEAAKKASVNRARFDRGGFLYHGRVKALADAARDGGLVF